MTSLDEIRRKRPLVYRIIDFDLSVNRVDEEIGIAGNFLYAYMDGLTIDLINGTPIPGSFSVGIKFNERENDILPLFNRVVFKTPFYRFYLSNLASNPYPWVYTPHLKIIVGMSLEDFSMEFLGEPQAPLIRNACIGNQQIIDAAAAATTVLMFTTPGYSVAILEFYSLEMDSQAAVQAYAYLFVTDSSDTQLYKIHFIVVGPNGQDQANGNPNLILHPTERVKLLTQANTYAHATIKIQEIPYV